MTQWKHWLTLAAPLAVTGLVLLACAAPAPTSTPTAKPVVVATPTKAPVPTPSPTKVAIRFEGGKLQPLPDGYPSKPITLYVSKVGASSDVMVRQLFRLAEPMSPVPLVIKNMTGGPTNYFLAARDADRTGYAFAYNSGSFLPENYVEGHNLAVGKDYVPVALVTTSDIVFFVKADSPWKTMNEFLGHAKANPGLRIPAADVAGVFQVLCEWLSKEAGVKWVCLPSDSSGDVVRSVRAGDVTAGLASMPAVQPQAEAGNVRILSTAASEKMALYPNVPRFSDLGYKIAYDHYRGFAVPGDVPRQRVEWLSALLVKAAQDPEFQKWAGTIGERVLGYGPDRAEALIKEIDPAMDRLTKDLGMRP